MKNIDHPEEVEEIEEDMVEDSLGDMKRKSTKGRNIDQEEIEDKTEKMDIGVQQGQKQTLMTTWTQQTTNPIEVEDQDQEAEEEEEGQEDIEEVEDTAGRKEI